MHGPEVMADEPRQDLDGAPWPREPPGHRRSPLGAKPVVADEPGPPVRVHAPRLRLGHVV
jgi:hypothetical protein